MDSMIKQKPGDVAIYYNSKDKRNIGWIERSAIDKSQELVDTWKVMIPHAYGAGEGIPHQILGQPFRCSKPIGLHADISILLCRIEKRGRKCGELCSHEILPVPCVTSKDHTARHTLDIYMGTAAIVGPHVD